MSLLIDEPPLQVLPSLAVKVGLNGAIILQQVHYWLQKSEHIKDGYKWVYNSYPKWHEQFPFWSEITIKRTILKLEKEGYLISGNYNKMHRDKTKWYRINYDLLKPSYQNDTNVSYQIDTIRTYQNDTNISYQNDTTITKDYTENTYHKYIYSPAELDSIISYLNLKTDKHFKTNSEKTKRLVNARFKEGYRVDDFKKVIDIKCSQWLNDEKMNRYLQPSTLFSTKFENYLNEKVPLKVVRDSYEDEYEKEIDNLF